MGTTRRNQITIRTLLFVTTLSALAVTIWINRPSGELLIEIEQAGSIQLDGNPIPNENLIWTIAK